MIVHEDGSFYLAKGETTPYACPECGWPKPFEKKPPPFMMCDHCKKESHVSEWEEAEFKFVKPN